MTTKDTRNIFRNIFQTPRHRCIGDEAMSNEYIVDTRCKMNGVTTKRRWLEYIVGASQKSIHRFAANNFKRWRNCIKSYNEITGDEGKLSRWLLADLTNILVKIALLMEFQLPWLPHTTTTTMGLLPRTSSEQIDGECPADRWIGYNRNTRVKLLKRQQGGESND